MFIQTADGIPIYCLPDCARCETTGENPEAMQTCPLRAFDYFGDICIPEQCDYYEEE